MTQLPAMFKALLDPKAYPETPKQIEMVQTQMSFVFLTDEHVYKVKKPVDLGYLDYTTLNKRHFYCQREVELNRRLPQEAMMDALLANNKVSPEIVVRVAQRLVEFHQEAETSAGISAFGELDTVTQNTEENFIPTEKYIGNTISRERY